MTIAEELAKKQKQVSVAEFFEKNRHLLGFANKQQALLTSVREAVDNALDACEEANILPEIIVKLKELKPNTFSLSVEDNGPGITKVQVPRVYGRFLYGSKFHELKQSRGQQGIGISSVVLYAQLTTGKPTTVTSKTKKGASANRFVMHIDTKRNEPEVLSEEKLDWDKKETGIKVEFTLQGKYVIKQQSVPEYIRQTAIVNPHAKVVYHGPEGKVTYPRVTEKLPKEPKTIKPHPYDMEHGVLKRMLKVTKARTVKSFLTTEFDKVGAGTANEIITIAGLDPKVMPRYLNADQIEVLLEGMQQAKIMAPSTDCLSPIGAEILRKSLESEYDLEFAQAITRPPAVYKGTPFQVEVAIGWGGELTKEGSVKVVRFANRVPLLYQQGACASTKAVGGVSWKSYGLEQTSGALPRGPAIIIVHIASVWVPFTSEGKEAVASYPAIIKEAKLALQECGRKLQLFIGKRRRAALEKEREETFKKYAGEVANAVSSLTGKPAENIKKKLIKIAEKNLDEMNGDSIGSDAEVEKK
tara:strand:- start:668 stop:2251 length:1584 start_codon:yes stop_codon:yes gene_type:complete